MAATELLSISAIAVARDARSTEHWESWDMSDHSGPVYLTAEGMDYREHERTYKGFVKLGTIFASAAATVVALLAIFLT